VRADEGSGGCVQVGVSVRWWVGKCLTVVSASGGAFADWPTTVALDSHVVG
jgi:hypothetical protein